MMSIIVSIALARGRLQCSWVRQRNFGARFANKMADELEEFYEDTEPDRTDFLFFRYRPYALRTILFFFSASATSKSNFSRPDCLPAIHCYKLELKGRIFLNFFHKECCVRFRSRCRHFGTH